MENLPLDIIAAVNTVGPQRDTVGQKLQQDGNLFLSYGKAVIFNCVVLQLLHM